jgi:hypothetical protein
LRQVSATLFGISRSAICPPAKQRLCSFRCLLSLLSGVPWSCRSRSLRGWPPHLPPCWAASPLCWDSEPSARQHDRSEMGGRCGRTAGKRTQHVRSAMSATPTNNPSNRDAYLKRPNAGMCRSVDQWSDEPRDRASSTHAPNIAPWHTPPSPHQKPRLPHCNIYIRFASLNGHNGGRSKLVAGMPILSTIRVPNLDIICPSHASDGSPQRA